MTMLCEWGISIQAATDYFAAEFKAEAVWLGAAGAQIYEPLRWILRRTPHPQAAFAWTQIRCTELWHLRTVPHTSFQSRNFLQNRVPPPSPQTSIACSLPRNSKFAMTAPADSNSGKKCDDSLYMD